MTAIIDPSATYLTMMYKRRRFMFRRRRWQMKKSGIVNLAKIRKEIGYLAHAQYDGIFGSDLKKIVNGKSYLYIDDNGDGYIYKAKQNNANTAGFFNSHR